MQTSAPAGQGDTGLGSVARTAPGRARTRAMTRPAMRGSMRDLPVLAGRAPAVRWLLVPPDATGRGLVPRFGQLSASGDRGLPGRRARLRRPERLDRVGGRDL